MRIFTRALKILMPIYGGKMKETGIVRRIDELGRVVIPKELRKTLKLKEGEQMEIFTTGDKSLVLRRYSALGSGADFSQAYCDALTRATGKGAVICDSVTVLGASGASFRGLVGEEISDKLYKTLDDRKACAPDSPVQIVRDKPVGCKNQHIVPLIVGGDLYGGVVLCSDATISATEARLCALAADLIAATLE